MSYFYATNCEDKFIANIMDVTLNLFFEIIPVNFMLYSHHRTFKVDSRIKALADGNINTIMTTNSHQM